MDKAMSQLPHILPDYMLVFAIPVLAHDPALSRWDDVHDLEISRQCLWFILEPLVNKSEYFSYGFYKSLIERMKNHKDALHPDDDSVNYVSLHQHPITAFTLQLFSETLGSLRLNLRTPAHEDVQLRPEGLPV